MIIALCCLHLLVFTPGTNIVESATWFLWLQEGCILGTGISQWNTHLARYLGERFHLRNWCTEHKMGGKKPTKKTEQDRFRVYKWPTWRQNILTLISVVLSNNVLKYALEPIVFNDKIVQTSSTHEFQMFLRIILLRSLKRDL